jgi:hypothetical protein
VRLGQPASPALATSLAQQLSSSLAGPEAGAPSPGLVCDALEALAFSGNHPGQQLLQRSGQLLAAAAPQLSQGQLCRLLAALATFLEGDSPALEAALLELQARLGPSSTAPSSSSEGRQAQALPVAGASSTRLSVEQVLLLLWAMSVLQLHQRPGFKRLHLSLAATALNLPPAVPRQPHLQRLLLESRMLLAVELRPARWRALSRRWQRRLEAGGSPAAPSRLGSWPFPLVQERGRDAAQGAAASASKTAAGAPAKQAAGGAAVPPPSMVATARRPGSRPGPAQAAAAGPSQRQAGSASSSGSSTAAARQWSQLKAQVVQAATAAGLQASWRQLAQGDEVCMLLRGEQRYMLCFGMPWHEAGGAQLAAGQVLQRVLRRQGWSVVPVELQAWCALRSGDEQRQHLLRALGVGQ